MILFKYSFSHTVFLYFPYCLFLYLPSKKKMEDPKATYVQMPEDDPPVLNHWKILGKALYRVVGPLMGMGVMMLCFYAILCSFCEVFDNKLPWRVSRSGSIHECAFDAGIVGTVVLGMGLISMATLRALVDDCRHAYLTVESEEKERLGLLD